MVTRIGGKRRPPHLYIKEHMDARGLSDADVAGRLEVAPVTVWRWYKEQWRLDPGKIAALAGAIGLESHLDLYRPPGRASIDGQLEGAPKAVYEAVLDLARKLAAQR